MDSPFAKALQDSASALYQRSITPLLQRCASYGSEHQQQLVSVEAKRAIQQMQNLKWQQEMFHRLLNLLCLFNEGLVPQQDVRACKSQVMSQLKSLHPDGEWAEFTRDKLLFLQDLLFAACISEIEYHAAKKPLILRLADQGAMLDAQDFVFGGRAEKASKKKAAKTPTKPTPETADDRSDVKTSPLRQVVGAVCRLKTPNSKTKKEKEIRRVPHALDFLRPEHCPVRDPPSPEVSQKPPETGSPFLASEDGSSSEEPPSSQGAASDQDDWFCPRSTSSVAAPADESERSPPPASSVDPKSPSRTPNSKFKTMLSGLIHRVHSDTDKTPKALHSSSESDLHEGAWGSQLWRPSRQLLFDEPPTDAAEPILSESRHLAEGARGQGPDTVTLKKKVHSKGAATDFFIDKVLGENIKNELSRIRAEMSRTQPGQTFSNEPIEAIATRLPVDKTELKKFFPQSWCERYGDIVLEVVRKEFKEHVGEMEKLRREAKEKRSVMTKKRSNSEENDENRQKNLDSPDPSSRGGAYLSKCFTTVDANIPRTRASSSAAAATAQHKPQDSPKKCKTNRQRGGHLSHRDSARGLQDDLQHEILTMPLPGVINECGSHFQISDRQSFLFMADAQHSISGSHLTRSSHACPPPCRCGRHPALASKNEESQHLEVKEVSK